MKRIFVLAFCEINNDIKIKRNISVNSQQKILNCTIIAQYF